jgi:hypothetical protein
MPNLTVPLYDARIHRPLALVILLLGAGPALAQTALPRSGRYGAGIGLQPLSIGPVEVASAGGVEAGLGLVGALQLDLGSRWALRLPVALDFTYGHGDVSFMDLTFTPGLLYRWRHEAEQRWVPYAGAGVRLGAVGARRELVGLPLVAPLHEHHGDHHLVGHHDDPNFDATLTAGPELWAGIEQRLNAWWILDWGLGYGWMHVDGVGIHRFRQTLGLRLTL